MLRLLRKINCLMYFSRWDSPERLVLFAKLWQITLPKRYQKAGLRQPALPNARHRKACMCSILKKVRLSRSQGNDLLILKLR